MLHEFLDPELKTMPPRHKKFRANRSMRDVEPSVNLWVQDDRQHRGRRGARHELLRTKIKPHGQVRQSQVVTTFGPGSMFDLPNHSVLVGGLDYWTEGTRRSSSPAWSTSSSDLLESAEPRLFAPPPDNEDPTATQKTGITCWQFPEWFITQDALATESGRSTRSRRLIPRSRP